MPGKRTKSSTKATTAKDVTPRSGKKQRTNKASTKAATTVAASGTTTTTTTTCSQQDVAGCIFIDVKGRKGLFTGQVNVLYGQAGQPPVLEYVKGTLVYEDEGCKGNTYQGEFHQGYMHGQGTFTTKSSGDVFEGTFVKDEFERGKITYGNGDSYEGECRGEEGTKHGKGTFRRTDKDNGFTMKGTWKNDELNGDGVLTFNDGDEYKGGFKNGEHHGHGTYTFNNAKEEDCRQYTGEWKLGKKHGLGRMEYKDGSHYVGEWQHNEPTGQGRATYVDEDFVEYAGTLKNGTIHGVGTLTYRNGQVYCGFLKQGKRHGLGELVELDGTRWVGEWRDDQKHGIGSTYHYETL